MTDANRAPETGGQEHEELQNFASGLVDAAHAGRSTGAGAVAIGVHRPETGPLFVTAGRTVSAEADGRPLAPDDPRGASVTEHTLFDLASVTKVITTLTAATLIDDGTLDLSSPACAYLPPGAVPDPRITVRHLLTHTSGLPPTMPLWRIDGTREEKLQAIGGAELASEPGERHAYSCIGFILLGRILEEIGGQTLPDLARERVLDPAGAHDVVWGPVDPATAAATEYAEDPPRGLVRGEVHDETAWSIGGVGNAGAFGTVRGALALARVLAGTSPGPRLSPATRSLLGTDKLGDAIPTGAPWRQGLGLRVGQALPEGAEPAVLRSVVGHPGFTGTAIWGDARTGTAAVLLTNRVHPHRESSDITAARAAFAQVVLAR